MTSVPSRPRLMRPERSVMHSPRLTNRNGVETRMAPPNTAKGTVQSPIDPSAMSGFSLQEADAPVQRIARQYEDEDDGKTIAGREIGVGAALHGGDLDHARKASRAACEKADRQDEFVDAKSD